MYALCLQILDLANCPGRPNLMSLEHVLEDGHREKRCEWCQDLKPGEATPSRVAPARRVFTQMFISS